VDTNAPKPKPRMARTLARGQSRGCNLLLASPTQYQFHQHKSNTATQSRVENCLPCHSASGAIFRSVELNYLCERACRFIRAQSGSDDCDRLWLLLCVSAAHTHTHLQERLGAARQTVATYSLWLVHGQASPVDSVASVCFFLINFVRARTLEGPQLMLTPLMSLSCCLAAR